MFKNTSDQFDPFAYSMGQSNMCMMYNCRNPATHGAFGIRLCAEHHEFATKNAEHVKAVSEYFKSLPAPGLPCQGG